MAEEFQGGVCGGSWWSSSSRNVFGSSLCSSDAMNDMAGGFGWPGHHHHHEPLFLGMKPARSSDESRSGSDGSVVLQGVQMMNTSSDDWSQTLLSSRSEGNYSSMLQAADIINSGMNLNYGQKSEDSSTTNTFEPMINNHQNFALFDHHRHPQFSPAGDYTTTTTTPCQGIPSSFPMDSNHLLQTLFDDDEGNTDHPPQDQKSLFQNQALNHFPENINYFSSLEGFSSSPPVLKTSLPFSRNTNCSWSTVASASPPPPSLQLPSFNKASSDKSNLRSLTTAKANTEELVGKKTNNEPAFKRPRIETPSPLPTFKVRKEKLGDRITALQQLVSPFGKTDTASVLHEAIEYIKFLHDQVTVFSSPYLKNGPPSQRPQTTSDRVGDQEVLKQLDLRSRGLCLVPISSTFPVAAETTSDFWTPSLGGVAAVAFR